MMSLNLVYDGTEPSLGCKKTTPMMSYSLLHDVTQPACDVREPLSMMSHNPINTITLVQLAILGAYLSTSCEENEASPNQTQDNLYLQPGLLRNASNQTPTSN